MVSFSRRNLLHGVSNNIQFYSELNTDFGQLNKWFNANLFSLNFDKTYFIQFTNKSACTSDKQIMYEDR